MGVTEVGKSRIIGLVLLGTLLLTACGRAPSPPASGAATTPKVLEMTDSVIPQQFGLITVQTQPRTNCTFSTEIKLKTGKTDKSGGETSSGSDGKAYWSWLVHPNAVPGTYPLTVNCGGKTVTAQYTIGAIEESTLR